MQVKIVLAALFAAASAAPSLASRVDSVPIGIWTGAGCNSEPRPVTTANVPTDGSCFPISPIVSGNTDSARIEGSQYHVIPTCKITLWADSTCSSVNFINVTESDHCYTFGTGKFVRSARVTGTC